MFLPYGRIENFFKEVFGLEISQGSFVNWVNEALKNAAPAIEKIKECIMKSAVVGFDESGLYCNKKLTTVLNCVKKWGGVTKEKKYSVSLQSECRLKNMYICNQIDNNY